jgi:cytochrome c553
MELLMKNIISYLLFIFAIVALFGFAFSFAQNKGGIDAKKVFEAQKCNLCHSVTSAGIISKKKDAVDLSTVGSTYKADFLTKYLKKDAKIKDTVHKIAFKGSDDELASITKWLESLKKK